ncbi:MAG: recombination protein RecR [Bdellovibrionaceae bacterium]|nr:recombination protein RecR [Pseudobdellovibrionaceae bacterium]
MLNISALEKLVHELSRLPGIGPKTAQRLAYHILRSKDGYVERLSDSLVRIRAEVHTCVKCFNYTDTHECKFCRDIHRTDDSLCVVEEPSDIMKVESSGAFRGRYHVLHGVISPLDGINAQDLKIKELIARIDAGLRSEGPKIKEVILALDADLEGDTTILYLAKLLQGKEVRLSRLAHGVPIGSDIEFIDDRTLGQALENRVEL